MESTLSDVYIDALNYPYCSATTYHRLIKQPTPDKLGSDCVEQAKKLREKLSDIETYYLIDVLRKIHHALICSVGEKTYLVDPYLLQSQPVELLPKKEFKLTIPGIPENEAVKIIIEKEKNKLAVQRKINNKESRQYRDEFFRFNLDERIYDDPTDEQFKQKILKKRPQPLIRVLDPRLMTITQLFYSPRRNQFKTGSNAGISKEETRQFSEDLESICSTIDCNEGEIKEHLMSSFNIWESLTLE